VSVILPSVDLAGNQRLCNQVLEIGAYEICNVGIKEFDPYSIHSKIFPIPANNRLIFEIEPEDVYKKNLSLQLVNAYGVVVKCISIYSSIFTVPIDQLTPGIYFYQINNLYRTLDKGKIIVE
jgi:hypothetical protein